MKTRHTYCVVEFGEVVQYLDTHTRGFALILVQLQGRPIDVSCFQVSRLITYFKEHFLQDGLGRKVKIHG